MILYDWENNGQSWTTKSKLRSTDSGVKRKRKVFEEVKK